MGSKSSHIKHWGFSTLSSKQGHLTRFLSFGLGLSVTAIEADHTLVAMASKFDGQLLWALEKERQKKVGALLNIFHTFSPQTKVGFQRALKGS